MLKRKTGKNVLDESLERLRSLYEDPLDRVVVQVSGGKDATVTLELAVKAAGEYGRLPVDAVYADSEVTVPGTNEYLLRLAERKDINLKWLHGVQPIENVLDRECPYWWSYDPLYKGSWLTTPPEPPVGQPRQFMQAKELVHPHFFPPGVASSVEVECSSCGKAKSIPVPADVSRGHLAKLGYAPKDGKEITEGAAKCAACKSTFPVHWAESSDAIVGDVYCISGTRSQESPTRRMLVASRGGWLFKKANEYNVIEGWPIYDWRGDDVWAFISQYNLDYNSCYDSLLRAGVKKRDLRLSFPTISMSAIRMLKTACKIWPDWGERVCDRIDGVRTALSTERHHPAPRKGETWKHLYHRTCLNNAPPWIIEVSEKVVSHFRRQHEKHGGNWADFPDEGKCCTRCLPNDSGSWRSFVVRGYAGFPLCLSIPKYTSPDPKTFREVLETRRGKS